MEATYKNHTLCTLEEAAAIIRVSPKTIQNDMSGQGKFNLRKVKIGGKAFLLRSEVEKYLQSAIENAK